MRWYISSALVILLGLFVACGSPDATPTPAGGNTNASPTVDATPTALPLPTDTPGAVLPELPETSWVLTAIDGQIIDSPIQITLSFQEGQAGGFSGCNQYGGAWTLGEDGSFSIPEIGMTTMACLEPAGIMDLEARYIAALQSAASARIDGDRLTLLDADGNALLVFSRDTRSELEGTAWFLIQIDGRNLIDNTRITIAFDDDHASGSGGCNDYGGAYLAGPGGSFSMTEVVTTEMSCSEPAGVMEQEQTYYEALRSSARWQIDRGNNRLELRDAAGRLRLIFANQEEMGGVGLLEATDWVLVSLRGEPVGDTVITLMLASRQYTGTAGCARYGGSIEVEPDGRIVYHHPYGDTLTCGGESPGETADAYLAALNAAAHYRFGGSGLQLLDADGNVLLDFRPGVVDERLHGEWTLISLHGKPPIPGTVLTLHVGEHGIGARYGCNSGGGDYAIVEPGVISIPGLVSTAMGCDIPPGVLDQEREYLDALASITGYQFIDDRLEMTNAGGETALVYTRYQPDPLSETQWLLEMVDGELVDTSIGATLSFSAGGITGHGGCNGIAGSYSATADGSLTLSDISTTNHECLPPVGMIEPPDLIAFDRRFFSTLAEVTGWRIDSDAHRLELLDADGDVRLRFIDQQVLGTLGQLRETAWVSTDDHRLPVTLIFAEDFYSGRIGCASYMGHLQVAPDGRVALHQGIAIDDACASDDDRQQIAAYLAILRHIHGIRIDADHLELLDADGAVVLTYRAGQSDEAITGAWRLTAIDGVSPVGERRLEIEVSSLWMWIDDGCDRLRPNYVISESGRISIAYPYRYPSHCEGAVADQEHTYWDALAGVVAYRVDGDRLELLDAAGETTLVYERAGS